MTETKRCARCQNTQPIERFYRSANKPDGRDCYCRDCRLKIQKRPRMKETLRRVSARHRELHPDRERARQTLLRAIRSGRIARKPCEHCGSLKAQAHHPDYSKPLDVVWLCRTHHYDLHLQERKIA